MMYWWFSAYVCAAATPAAGEIPQYVIMTIRFDLLHDSYISVIGANKSI